MVKATGASRAAVGVVAADEDSTLVLVEKSALVLISNHSGATARVALNQAVTTDAYDFRLEDGERVWIDAVAVAEVHVLVNASSGIRVVYW